MRLSTASRLVLIGLVTVFAFVIYSSVVTGVAGNKDIAANRSALEAAMDAGR